VGGICSQNEEKINAYRLLVGIARGKETTRKIKTKVGE
jgi:hypothetical protein